MLKTGFDSNGDSTGTMPFDRSSYDRTQQEVDIIAMILDSRVAVTSMDAKQHLIRAMKICDGEWESHGHHMPSLKLEVRTELAKIAESSDDRHKLWSTALDEGLSYLHDLKDVEYAKQLYGKIVDFSRDPFTRLTPGEANSLLSRGKKSIDSLLSDLGTVKRGQLLACKASLLRRGSKYQISRPSQVHVIDEALRCANKACEMSPLEWASFLELGQCHWEKAKYEKFDGPYADRLKEVETCLWRSIELQENVYNTFTLAQFYRGTYQTTPFLKCYEQYSLLEQNKRFYLQSSYLYAEGAIQLFYGDYPEPMINAYLEDADRLLESALDAGYADARHIVDLAFVKAARGEVPAGIEVAKLLHPKGARTSWTDVAKVVCDDETNGDLIAKGFALGIDQSSIWNKLGTYANRFLGDLDLAITMYRTALTLRPANAVAMTNLSRALLTKGAREDIEEAQRWISKAASCADRRFRWWRNVREAIALSLVESDVDQTPPELKDPTRAKRLADLNKAYQALKTLSNTQQRGYEFERLIEQLIKFSLGNSRPSSRTKQSWADDSIMQLDAAFCFLGTQYFRVETKWTSDPTSPKDIVLFHAKLDAVGVKGLFISVNGFTPEAISRAASYRNDREILLMDGHEVDLVLKGSPSFDEAVRRKQQYFAFDSNPYYRIAPSIQEEVD